eukprot:6636443-Pyramimonas_sp.AAC.2
MAVTLACRRRVAGWFTQKKKKKITCPHGRVVGSPRWAAGAGSRGTPRPYPLLLPCAPCSLSNSYVPSYSRTSPYSY